MAAPTIVSTSQGYSAFAPSFTHALNLPSGSGGLLLAFIQYGENGGLTITSWPGWTQLPPRGQFGFVDGFGDVWYREADGSEGSNITVTTSGGTVIIYVIHRLSGYGGPPVAAGWAGNVSVGATTTDPPALTTGFGAVPTRFFAAMVWGSNGRTVSSYPSGYSGGVMQTGTQGAVAVATKAATAASDDPGIFTLSSDSWQVGNTVAVQGSTAPDAEFTYSKTASLTYEFTDESTGVPTSWSWDFGDGHTSTAQNPSHVYAIAGVYTVTLTATNASGSDAVSHDISATADVPYVPPAPGLALLEIYTSDPASPRWDLANWDEANWGASGWQDVTPYGVDVTIQWGVTRPELGILARPDAANWAVDFYDPFRIMDPANADSPYYSDLRPGLPIRVTHRGVVIKTGVADVIGHSLRDDTGLIRGSDIISMLARADVPESTILADTLWQRAADAIAAAGLSVVMEPLTYTDPPLGEQLSGVHSVWDHILDAAQAVLWQPTVSNDARLGFRQYSDPIYRGRELASPNLIDLLSIVDTAGLVSEVHVQQTVADGGVLISRSITPPPYFGVRIMERTEETPNADDWADAVLNDRATSGVRWVPGQVYPLTADDVEYFATILPMELVALLDPDTIPVVDASAVILGGTVTVTGRQDDSAEWRFSFEAVNSSAITGTTPLTLDGGAATDFLTTESGSEYLYVG